MKNTDSTLIYDNSFSGFLSAVYIAFKEDLSVSEIHPRENVQNLLFSDAVDIRTEKRAARRIWQAIQKRNYEAAKTIYFAYLSESKGIELLLYNYIRSILSNDNDTTVYIDAASLKKIRLMAGLVSREKKRMENQVLLQQAYPDLQLAYIEPDFNVLPLITKYFKSSQNIQPWIIYDRRRKYGIYYDGRVKHIITSDLLKTLLTQKHLAESPAYTLNPGSEASQSNHALGREIRKKHSYPDTISAA
ncbi:MAG: TIGR03915 family putative DNA repair protein [Flavobacteriaceae bacterium]